MVIGALGVEALSLRIVSVGRVVVCVDGLARAVGDCSARRELVQPTPTNCARHAFISRARLRVALRAAAPSRPRAPAPRSLRRSSTSAR